MAISFGSTPSPAQGPARISFGYGDFIRVHAEPSPRARAYFIWLWRFHSGPRRAQPKGPRVFHLAMAISLGSTPSPAQGPARISFGYGDFSRVHAEPSPRARAYFIWLWRFQSGPRRAQP